MNALFRAVLVLAASGLMAACSSGPSRPLPAAVPVVEAAASQPAPAFTLSVGDELDIKVPDAPLYDQTVKIRPDGKVTLNVVGAVHAVGRTPEDVQDEIRERYRQAGGGVAQREYLLNPNDELDIKFPYLPSLNEQVRIRPDGKIQLQMAGTVQAEGLSPEALQAELKRRYSKVLRSPELSVIVRTATSQVVRTDQGMGRAGVGKLQPLVMVRTAQAQQVFLAGEVAKPGILPYTPGMTLLQALAGAGGHLPSGDVEHLVVMRRNANQTAQVIEPHLPKQYLAEPDKDMVLQPFDVVLLPPTGLARAGQNVEQWLRVLPPLRNTSFGFVYNLNNKYSN